MDRAFSAYLDSIADGAIRNITLTHLNSAVGPRLNHLDLLAFMIVIAFLVFLSFGVRTTSHLNNIFSVINIAVILVIIVVGGYFADTKNWTEVKGGFMPYGWKGVFAASASCFYAFIGFDAIATSGEEAQDPQKSIPLATMISMAFVTLAYVGVSSVLTLMVPYDQINDESGLPDALGLHGAGWAKILVIAGACCGMTCVLIGTMYSLTRIVYAMAEDGLLFGWMSKINERTQIPLKATYCFALCAALLALTLDITTLVEMMSIGTLLAYLVVSASVIVVRYQPIKTLSIASETVDPIASGAETEESNAAFHYEDRKESETSPTESHHLHPSIKSYLPQVDMDAKLRSLGPEALVTICVFAMTLLIFILCFLGPPLLQVWTSCHCIHSVTVLNNYSDGPLLGQSFDRVPGPMYSPFLCCNSTTRTGRHFEAELQSPPRPSRANPFHSIERGPHGELDDVDMGQATRLDGRRIRRLFRIRNREKYAESRINAFQEGSCGRRHDLPDDGRNFFYWF